MDRLKVTALSKFLSLVLRHEPKAIGVKLDARGWIAIDQLLAACAAHGETITRTMLDEIIATSPKQRFAVSDDGLRIRANHGHSIGVDLACEPATPPEPLFHGTVADVLPAIRDRGLLKMARQYVHLSAERETARIVAVRRGTPLILEIAAGRMHFDGHVFFRSTSGVWLTDNVPPAYLTFPPA